MKRLTFFSVIFFALAFGGRGQVNLVPNGDFEEYTTCPIFTGQIDSCKYWFNPTIFIAPADYFNRCSPYYQNTVPYAHWGNQEAYSGDGYCYFCLYGGTQPDYREYIEVPLKSTLQPNKCYHIRMYINAPNRMEFTSNDVSCYFSDTIVKDVNYWTNLPFKPQCTNTSIYPDTTNWTLVACNFIANGGENYLIIGNFDNDSLTNTVIINPSIGACPQGGIYIDDVSVIEKDLSVLIPHDTIIHPGDSIYIGGQTGIGLDEDCIWFVNGVPIDTIAGLWVKPDTTTTYILQQTICGNIKYDTIMVTVSGVGVDEYNSGNNWVHLFPNPASTQINIETNSPISEIIITDISGKTILRQTVNNSNESDRVTLSHPVTNVDISRLAPGLYFIKIISEKQSLVRKIMVY